jgi:hypothetical protein
MLYDPTGCGFWSWIGRNIVRPIGNVISNAVDTVGNFLNSTAGQIIVTVAIIAVLAVATVMTGGVAGVILGAMFWGAVTGAVTGAAIGAGAGIITGLTTGDWSGMLGNITSGMMFGALGGAAFGAISSGVGVASGVTRIIGSAQKTGNVWHRFASNVQAGKFAMQIGRYSNVSLDRGLYRVGLVGKRKPDVVAVARIGNNKIIEVVSRFQSVASQERKIMGMLSVNPRTTGKVIGWILQRWFLF